MSNEISSRPGSDVCGRNAGKTYANCAADLVYRRLVQSITDYAIYMLDVDGVITTWNAAAQKAKGYI